MINNIIRIAKQTAITLLVFFAGSSNSYASSTDISQTPLFLGSGVQPNVFFLKAADGDIESEDTVFILNKIDRIKKVLTLADAKIAYNTSTIFIDNNGNKKSIKDLVIGQVVSYQYDYKARYYSMPVATRIVVVL